MFYVRILVFLISKEKYIEAPLSAPFVNMKAVYSINGFNFYF